MGDISFSSPPLFHLFFPESSLLLVPFLLPIPNLTYIYLYLVFSFSSFPPCSHYLGKLCPRCTVLLSGLGWSLLHNGECTRTCKCTSFHPVSHSPHDFPFLSFWQPTYPHLYQLPSLLHTCPLANLPFICLSSSVTFMISFISCLSQNSLYHSPLAIYPHNNPQK